MTRLDIIDTFRVENPELTDRVITDAQLYEWCLIGDKEVCAITRCILSDFTITSAATTTVYNTRYNLTTYESKFYAIDDYPGGGVSFDNTPLRLTSIAELDEEDPNWRDRSAGEPEAYYRRGQWLYLDRPISSSYASLTIRIYCSLISNDFDGDNKAPFNELTFLEPFHYAMVLFLQKKAKMKVGKPNEELKAVKEYNDYVAWMKKEIGATKISPIRFQPPANRYSTGQ